MRIDRERNSSSVTFDSELDILAIREKIGEAADKIDGLIVPTEIMHEGDSYVISVSHRESLKGYIERDIFELKGFAVLLKGLSRLIEELHVHNISLYDCLWDIDMIFIGIDVGKPEIIYIPEYHVYNSGNTTSLSDLTAIVSLRVYEENEDALKALSEAVACIDRREKEALRDGIYNDCGIMEAYSIVKPYCEEAGLFTRAIRFLTEGLFRRNVNKQDEQHNKDAVPVVETVEMAETAEINNIGDNIGDNICDNICGNICDSGGDNICDNIGGNIGDNIGNSGGVNENSDEGGTEQYGVIDVEEEEIYIQRVQCYDTATMRVIDADKTNRINIELNGVNISSELGSVITISHQNISFKIEMTG